MGKVGFIGGSNLLKSNFLKNAEKLDTKNNVLALKKDGFIFLQRHGKKNVSPHLINHGENMEFFKKNNVTSITSLCSVGSLKNDLIPGSICLVKDFLSFYNIVTYDESIKKHITPELDKGLSKKIKENLEISTEDVVYWQTTGPRFETPAEINLIKNFADVVGMTLGSECTIASEFQIKYSAIAIIDNYCNGISDVSLSYEKFEEMVKLNQEKADNCLRRLVNVFTF